METLQSIIQLLYALLPALLIFLTAFVFLYFFFKSQEQRFDQKIKIENQKISLPMRLSAYERLLLFLERMSLNSLISRSRQEGMSASDLQVSMIMNVRAEFDHNLTQQLYVSKEAWEEVKKAKEETIKIINISFTKVQGQDAAIELSKVIFEQIINSEEDQPNEKAIDFLKTEAARLL